MKMTRYILAAMGAAFILAGHAQAQTVIQILTFSLYANYQTNIVETNDKTVTNTVSYSPDVLITSANLVKAIAVDLEGTNWATWYPAYLVREINLATTNQAMFLRRNGLETNVSRFFTGFSNDFSGGLATDFPGFTNFTSQTNSGTSTNYLPPLVLNRGTIFDSGKTQVDYSAWFGVHSLSLHTTNLQFNVIGAGHGSYTNVYGRYEGVEYGQLIKQGGITFLGAFTLNVTTNVIGTGTNPPVFTGGPMHGALLINAPVFDPIAGP